MAQHGKPYMERRALLREKILMMKALWTQDEASFDGELMTLEPSWAWPKPQQTPHPPIVMGAAPGPKTLADIAEFCDGWIPLATRQNGARDVEKVRASVAEAAHDPGSIEVTAYAAKVDRLDSLAAAGVDRVVFSLPPLGPDVVVPKLDELARGAGLE